MGNCGCTYIMGNAEVINPNDTDIQINLSENEKIHIQIEEFNNSNSFKSSSRFKKKGPIIVKLQTKKFINKKLL